MMPLEWQMGAKMISTVVSVGLPVEEVLNIYKRTLTPLTLSGKEKRFCIVSGLYGDELEGQFVCYELMRRINAKPECLKGIIDIYPAVNPLGMEAITRGIPTFDLDMNRSFPGNEDGDMVERIAAKVVEEIIGADMCLDLHASNIFIREIPQVRLSDENVAALSEYAKMLNVDFVWAYESPTVLESTLVHTLNKLGVPTLAVEMGVGMRITQEYGMQLVDGILCLLKKIGIWDGETITPKEPMVSTEGEVEYVHAEASGIFLPAIEHWKGIKKGDTVGDIINSLTGKVEHHITAPCDGMVFSLREYPVVYEGSLIARILGGAV